MPTPGSRAPRLRPTSWWGVIAAVAGIATDPDHRALRIRQLQEPIATAAVGHEPPDDGVAEPGMVLTVRYEADDLTETFLMADREESTPDGLRSTHPTHRWARHCAGPKRGNNVCICSPEAKR